MVCLAEGSPRNPFACCVHVWTLLFWMAFAHLAQACRSASFSKMRRLLQFLVLNIQIHFFWIDQQPHSLQFCHIMAPMSFVLLCTAMSQCNIAGIVTRLQAEWEIVYFLAGGRDLSLVQNLKETSPGAHSHLILRLRMTRAVPLLPVHTFMVCTETTLPF